MLAQLGAAWLGRDVFDRAVCKKPVVESGLIADAARYGFHATLKAPFHLKDGCTEAQLIQALNVFNSQKVIVNIGPIKVSDIEGFLALVPEEQSQDLSLLADDCVRAFDGLRRPMDEQELARRRLVALSPRQDDHLRDWGYPFVFEDFRFHMTLTSRLSTREKPAVLAMAERHFYPIVGKDLVIDQICLFSEPESGADFTVIQSFNL